VIPINEDIFCVHGLSLVLLLLLLLLTVKMRDQFGKGFEKENNRMFHRF
jgi:hypothetical protein